MPPDTSFKPMTKEHVADILGVSTRTIENWVNDRVLPAPKKLGNRVYWHPRTFYEWLNVALAGDTAHECDLSSSDAVPSQATGRSKASVYDQKQRSLAGKRVEAASLSARDQAKLDALVS